MRRTLFSPAAIRRLLCGILSFLLVWNPVAAAVTPRTTGDESLAAATRRIELLSTQVEKLRSQIDRSQFDLGALLERLDYDEEAIIQFVREEIAFELYEGVLRGPRGTLMSRAGNSLDQSMLLAKLLGDAGLETRIMGGRLNAAQTLLILEQLRPGGGGQPRPFMSDDYLAIVDELTALAGVEEDRAGRIRQGLRSPASVREDPASEQAQSSVALIRRHLSEAGIDLSDGDADQALQREAAQFYWVEYRDGPARAWQTVQPTFAAEDLVSELPPAEEVYVREIPPELQHRVRLQVFIEQKVGNKLVTHAITAPWERPAANLHAVPLTFTNIPQLLADGLGNYPDANTMLDESTYIAPVLLGDSFDEFQAFDLAGNTIDAMVINRSEGGVFKEVNRAFNEAAGAVSGGKGPITELTAQWLEFTFIAPRGAEKSVKRFTFDRVGAAKRAQGSVDAARISAERPYSLLQRHTFMVATGDLPRSHTLDETLDRLLAHRPLYDALNTARAAPDKAVDAVATAMKEMSPHWQGMTMLMHRLSEAEDLVAGRLVFRDSPALTVFAEGLVAEDRVERYIDIVANPRRVMRVDGDEPKLDRAGNVLAGVWDTRVERDLLPSRTGDVRGTPRAIALAEEQRIPLALVRSAVDVESLALDPDTRLDLLADIEDGYVVLVPAKVPAGAESDAWWRIDPATGETLGIGSGRRGIAISEEAILTMATFFSLGALYYGSYGCFADLQPGDSGSATFICCLILNYGLWAAGGAMTGFLATKVFGWVAALASVEYDVFTGFLTSETDPCA